VIVFARLGALAHVRADMTTVGIALFSLVFGLSLFNFDLQIEPGD
jgi:hypothetical protein